VRPRTFVKGAVIVLALALIAPSPAAADEVPRLTLADALALFRRQNPELLAGRLRVDAARGDLTTARLLPNPTLSLGAGNLPLGRTNPPGLGVRDTITGQAGVAQEVPLWGKRSAGIAAATGKTAEAEALRRDLERRLAFEVRARFTAVLVATARLRLARESLDRYRDTLGVMSARARAGDISNAEYDKVALEQRSFEREVARAEIDRREAVADLLPLCGLDGTDVEAVGELAPPAAPADAEALVADALTHRPDLDAAKAEVESTQAALRLARAKRWPNPTVDLQYTHSEFLVSGDLGNQLGVGVSLPLPLFDRNQGDVQRAAAEALVAERDLQKLRLEIPQEVRSAVTHYITARERVRRFDEAFLAEARTARHAAEVAYREGTVSLLEFLEAERTSLDTETDHLEALEDAHRAAFEVDRAAAVDVKP